MPPLLHPREWEPFTGSNKLSLLGENSFCWFPEMPGKTGEPLANYLRKTATSAETGSSWWTQDILSLGHFKKKKATFFQLSQSSERHLERKGFYNMNMSSDVSNPTSTPKLLKYLWVKLTHKNLLLTEKNKQRGTILHGSYLVTFFLM